MTDTPRDLRGELAAFALGRVDLEEARILQARLDRDPALRGELAELRAIVDVLSLADLEQVDRPLSPPPELQDAVIEAVKAASRDHRRRRRVRTLVASGAVAALVLVIALVVTLAGRSTDDLTPFDVKPEGVAADYALDSRPWGTEVELGVAGLDSDEVYWLWLSDAEGNRSAAGTFWGAEAHQQLTLASSLSIDEAERIWVTDESDEVVLDSVLD